MLAFADILASFRASATLNISLTVKTSAKQIATRYVKALIDSVDNDIRPQVESDMNALALIYKESDIFRDVLISPLLSREQQGKALETVLDAIKASPTTGQFIAMLSRQKRLALLPDIIELFNDAASKERGELKAEVISATELSKADVSAIAERLGKAYGKKIIVQTRQDPALLGGITIKIGSLQLDGSLAGKLQRLKNTLKAA